MAKRWHISDLSEVNTLPVLRQFLLFGQLSDKLNCSFTLKNAFSMHKQLTKRGNLNIYILS